MPAPLLSLIESSQDHDTVDPKVLGRGSLRQESLRQESLRQESLRQGSFSEEASHEQKLSSPWEEHWPRLVEVSADRGSGCFTTAVSNLLEAQERDEPMAWVQLERGAAGLEGGALYPPDLADSGVDLDALLVIQAPSPKAQLRGAELLLRSGAFGLVVVDLSHRAERASHAQARTTSSWGTSGRAAFVSGSTLPTSSSTRITLSSAWQSRLAALAREHESRVLVISSSADEAPSLGPMIGLRLAPRWERRAPGELLLGQTILKNKGGVPLKSDPLLYRTPTGML